MGHRLSRRLEEYGGDVSHGAFPPGSILALEEVVGEGRKGGAYERTNDEDPEADEGSRVARGEGENGRPEATGGIDRGAREADAQNVQG